MFYAFVRDDESYLCIGVLHLYKEYFFNKCFVRTILQFFLYFFSFLSSNLLVRYLLSCFVEFILFFPIHLLLLHEIWSGIQFQRKSSSFEKRNLWISCSLGNYLAWMFSNLINFKVTTFLDQFLLQKILLINYLQPFE